MLDNDLREMRELEKLEWEVELLHADGMVTAHEVHLLRLEKYAATHPEDPLVHESKVLAASLAAARRRWPRDWTVRRYWWRVEQSCYGWRRDYGEWPTRWNLADRLANDARISRHTAAKRIDRSLNLHENQDFYLWATTDGRFEEVLEDGPEWTGWVPSDYLRYFVTAEGMEALDCDWVYRTTTTT